MSTEKQTSTKLISLTEAAKGSPYSADYLNLLVRRGKLPAKKVGRNWFTSQAAMEWYLKKQNKLDSQPEPVQHVQTPHTAHPSHHLGMTTYLRWLILALAIFLLLLLQFPGFVFGMSSPNFTINESHVGTGGTRESSANYQVLETIGDIGTGNTGSPNYQLRIGYLPGTEDASLIFTVSTANLNLGSISPADISSNSHTMTVRTDLTRGYTITAQADGDFRSGARTIPFVADGTVTAGTAEYGASFSGGLGSHPAGDISLDSLVTVTNYADNVANGDTTIATYKASASGTTQPGTYSSTTTYIATGSF